jgi:hypothetical protein
MRRSISTFIAFLAIGLVGAPAALGAQEVGDRCVGNDSEVDWTAIVLTNGLPTLELPTNVQPEGQKVITRWRAQLGPGMGPIAQQLVAFKQVEMEEDQLVGESAIETLVAGSNEFATRIPVPSYAHVGLRGPVETVFCDKLDGHLGGIVEGPWAMGEVRKFQVSMDVGVPVVATVEPDADADGYGDETQDGCSRSAATQGPCPVVNLEAGVEEIRRGAILVYAAINVAAPVTVSGQVSWPLPRPRKVPAKSITAPKQVVTLPGETQQLAAGARSVLRVPLPRRVNRKLGTLPRNKRLQVRIVVAATGPALEWEGQQGRDFVVKLPGRARPN